MPGYLMTFMSPRKLCLPRPFPPSETKIIFYNCIVTKMNKFISYIQIFLSNRSFFPSTVNRKSNIPRTPGSVADPTRHVYRQVGPAQHSAIIWDASSRDRMRSLPSSVFLKSGYILESAGVFKNTVNSYLDPTPENN